MKVKIPINDGYYPALILQKITAGDAPALTYSFTLLMRLTADLIEKSAAFTNPLGERELDLRSKLNYFKIPVVFILFIFLFLLSSLRQQNPCHRKFNHYQGPF